MKTTLRFLAALLGLLCLELHAGSLRVTIAPSQAVNAGAKWRVDGGSWRNSGATVNNLSNTTHTVDFKTTTGWIAPAATSVVIASGNTTTLAATYVQPAALQITLTPATGQWRIDGGTWQTSAATVTGLTPGNHTVAYSSLAGYASPTTETVTLVSAQTTTLTRAYVQLAQVTVTLTPSSGQWRVDGGAWQTSGATVGNLAPGNHSVEYSQLSANWSTPPAETIALAAGASLSLTRSYTALSQVLIALVPSSGQWRLNGGAWQASGTSLWVPAGSYTVDYSPLELYDPPATETITAGFATTRYYTSQKPALRVNLTPSTGQWRLDGGAWRTSGTELTELATGTHTLDYTDIGGDRAPLASETISLALREHAALNRTYPWKPASVTMTMSPAMGQWALTGQIGSGWQNSGTTLTGLTPANNWHIEFANVANYTAPAPLDFTLAPGENASFTRSYTPLPASLRVSFIQSGAQWRAYPAASAPGGAWNNSSILLTGLAPGDYVVEYSPVANYDAPATETVTLAPNQTLEFVRTYTPHPAQLTVTMSPASGQWRVDGGTWQTSGATVGGLSPGQHAVEYSALAGYNPLPSESVTLTAGQALALTRAYVPFTQLTVTLYPSSAQWRIDGGAWRDSGTSASGLSAGSHTVDYLGVTGYAAPPAETVTLYSDQTILLYRYYTQLSQLTVTLYPSSAQWRVDGGAWQNSGTTVSNLAYDVPHSIDYSTIIGYVTPTSDSVTLYSGEQRTHSRYYSPLSQLTVTLYPSSAQWRVDGGAWQNSGTTVANLSYDVPHSIDYSTVIGYVTPTSDSVTLYSGEQRTHSRYYTQLSQLTVTLYPSNAQWRVDGGAWQNSGTTVSNLAYDVPHSIDYSTIIGYVTPTSDSVTLYSGEQRTHSRYYSPLSQLTVTLYPSNAQWRVDGGAWQNSGTTVANLTFDVPHLVEFRAVAGYGTPPPQSITLYSGETRTLSAYYSSLGIHRLRFFIHSDLAGSLPLADVRSRAAQTAAHLTQIFTRETLRVFTPFDPVNDVAVVSADPFSGSYNGWMPDAGFEIWVYATLTDNPAIGTYGGSVGVDSTGAGGARAVKFDQLHDPSALTDGTPAMAQYWRQLHLLTRHLERTFGAGPGGYDSLGGLHDASGVAPVVADVAAVDSASPDAFWTARFDFWTDPLTANAYANPRLGSPTSLATLLNLTSFASATRGVINSLSRNPDSWSYYTLPNLTAVVVKVVNAQTGAPIPTSTLRVWNRQNPSSPNSTYEETVTTTGTAGVFTFSWTGSPTPLTANDNAKLLKASATGYTPAAQWTTIYDAQTVKLIDGKDVFEITLALSPQ